MQRSPTYSPTPIRPPSIDSLCMPDDEHFSLTAAQEVSSSLSTAPTVRVLHEDSVRDSIMPPPVSDSTTTLGSTGPSAQQPKPTLFKTTFFRDKWLWETTCIIFSIACVIAITILSSRLDGTWVSKWSFFVQPSTTFSILITAAQSSMMVVVAEVLSQLKWLQMSLPRAQSVANLAIFDLASRGPLGSLRLFYRWKPQSSVLPPMAYAASLITITALAMGPFTQQVISIQTENLVPTDGINSTIAVSNSYDYQPSQTNVPLRPVQMSPPLRPRQIGPPLFIDKNGTITKTTDYVVFDVDPDVQGSFYNGYYSLGKSFIDFSCPSNNCSWEVFSSLGICSTCQNVTETIGLIRTGYSHIITTPRGWAVSVDRIDKVVAATNDLFLGSTVDTLSANIVSTVVVQRPSNVPEDVYVVTECTISWCAKQYSNVNVVRSCFIPSLLLCL